MSILEKEEEADAPSLRPDTMFPAWLLDSEERFIEKMGGLAAETESGDFVSGGARDITSDLTIEAAAEAIKAADFVATLAPAP